MKRKLAYLFALAVSLLSVLMWPATAWPARGARLVVDDDKVECPSAGFAHIQDAIEAASPGDEIHICKGSYVEQVKIGKPLAIDADNGAILMPSAMMLTVDGANNGISQCTPDLIGISFQNASGALARIAVRNFKLAASLNGCQSGTGIFVQSGNRGVSKVEIDDCTVHDFQKNGITADEKGTTTVIRRNVVTGIGPIFIHGNNAAIDSNETFATVVFDDIRVQGDQSRVRRNHVLNGAESGIFLSGNNNVVTENVITEAAVGILKESGSSGNIIAGNRFFNTRVPVQDPQFINLAKLISPKR